MNINAIIQLIAVSAIPLIFAITLHEAAHGYAAKRFGDATAWMMGRVTLNPAKHIDPVGTIAVPLIMLIGSAAAGGGFLFGWAKPVPVNFRMLRNPKRDMIWVALSGPASNFVQALFWAIVLRVLFMLGVEELFFLQMAAYGISINIFLMAFNLIPIPPLDGGRVAVGVLPWSVGRYLDRIEPYGMWIVVALCLFGGAGFFTAPLVHFGRLVVSFVIGG